MICEQCKKKSQENKYFYVPQKGYLCELCFRREIGLITDSVFYTFQTFRKPNKTKCFQYRINGRIVSESCYWDTRCDISFRGAKLIDIWEEENKKGNIVNVLMFALEVKI